MGAGAAGSIVPEAGEHGPFQIQDVSGENFRFHLKIDLDYSGIVLLFETLVSRVIQEKPCLFPLGADRQKLPYYAPGVRFPM